MIQLQGFRSPQSSLTVDTKAAVNSPTFPTTGTKKPLTIMKDIINKFKFKDKGIVINAPSHLEAEFVKLDFGAAFKANEHSKNTLVFINNNKEFLAFLGKGLKNVEPDSVLWFAYPKGTSNLKTDINRDTIRKTGEVFGITTVAAISIDDTWSALRFRPIDKVGK